MDPTIDVSRNIFKHHPHCEKGQSNAEQTQEKAMLEQGW